jgi:hypothetical protein
MLPKPFHASLCLKKNGRCKIKPQAWVIASDLHLHVHHQHLQDHWRSMHAKAVWTHIHSFIFTSSLCYTSQTITPT